MVLELEDQGAGRLVSGEDSLLALQRAPFWLCPHMDVRRAGKSVSEVSEKGTNPVRSGLPPYDLI